MTGIQTINVGASPNDGTGDSLRDSFIIVNNNFSYITTIIGNSSGNIVGNLISLGTSEFNNLTANSANIASGDFTGNFTGNIFGNLSGNLSGDSVVASTLSGVLTTNAQPNVTSLGSLFALLAANVLITENTISNVSTIYSFSNVFRISNLSTVTRSTSLEDLGSTQTLILDFANLAPQFTLVNITSDITYSYSSTISAGYQRHVSIKNVSGSDKLVTLPTANNNLGTTTFTVTDGTIATMIVTAYDETSANVIAFIGNK